MTKKLKLEMSEILDLGDYETATIATESDFIKHKFKGNKSLYAMMSGRNRTTLARRKPDVERLVIEYRGRFIQVDVKADIFLGE